MKEWKNEAYQRYARTEKGKKARYEAVKRFMERNKDLWRNHHREYMKSLCEGSPRPSLKVEDWSGEKIRVSRKSNGRFISWREVD